MKTTKQLAKETGLENEEGVQEDYALVQKDVLNSCFLLCIEGVKEFKKMGMSQAAEGCDACAANIVVLAKEHGIIIKL